MNEKFFDLKKEKQDRIINAAMKVFAEEGYTHASTDEMVKEARISKGLLFHYFISKLQLYGFLYDYSVRFVTLELSRNVSSDETDYFTLQEQLLSAWADAMRQYPYIRLFLTRAESEKNADAAGKISDKRATFLSMLGEIDARTDTSAFAPGVDPAKIRDMARYTLSGVLRDADKTLTQWQEHYLKDATSYLRCLKRLAYGGTE